MFQQAVDATLAENLAVVEAWQTGTPKAWGHLAGRAVGTARRLAGRDLTDVERRHVWATLWHALQQLTESP